MKVGLIDIDLLNSPKIGKLNTELIKLGVYYENNGHQVEVLHEKNSIYDYDKLIVFSEVYKPIKNYLTHPNVDFYGNYYSNKVFIPFNNDIDYYETNYKIYDNFLRYYFLKKVYKERDIRMFKNSQWERLYPNKNPIDIYKILTGNNVYLSDTYFFDRDGWREVVKRLAIYPSKIHFSRPLMIKNQNDFEDFLFMTKLNFTGLKGNIVIDNYDEFESFILKNKDIMKSLKDKFIFTIGYNSKNLYSESFYLMNLIPTFKMAILLSKCGITYANTEMSLYTNQYLSGAVYRTLSYWFNSSICNRMTFHICFLQMNKKSQFIINYYHSFIKNNPQYKAWVNKIINEEE